MSLLDELPVGEIAGIDTAPLIYFIEGHAQYGPVVRPLFDDRIDQGLNRGVTSMVSLAEALVGSIWAETI